MQREILQTLQSQIEHRRDARDRLGIHHTVFNHPKAAGPLSDQHVAIREKHQREGAVQPLNGHHTEFLDDAGKDLWPVGQGVPGRGARLRRITGLGSLLGGGHGHKQAEHERHDEYGRTFQRK